MSSEMIPLGDADVGEIQKLLASITSLRDIHAHWLTEMYKHFQPPSQREIIRNGFHKAGIVSGLEPGNNLLRDDPFEEKYGKL